jgi:hypothetical protein
VSSDPIAKFRPFAEASPRRSSTPPLPTFDEVDEIGAIPRFKGRQEIRVSVVLRGGQWRVLIQTFDREEEEWKLSRWILLEYPQVPAVLDGLINAEILLATLSSTPRQDWTSLPHTTGEAPCSSGDTTMVQVDEWNDRLDVKMTTFVGCSSSRTGQWAKFGGLDIRDMMRLLIQAFDTITESSTSRDSSDNEDPLGF